MKQDSSNPVPVLSVTQASAMLVGIVVGIGIFKTPPIVAAQASSEMAFIGLWLLGGVLTLVGALCYAELGSAYPSSGGEYHYLKKAYGRAPSFLFAWGRMTVIQSGAIAAVAFAYGDYASGIVPLGPYGPALHAVIAVSLLSGLQLVGTGLSGRAQLVLTILTILAVLVVAVAGFAATASAVPSQEAAAGGEIGFAMVMILLTYGGWNEAAYLSGEVRDPGRNMVRVLLLGSGTVVALYLLVNIALVSASGLSGLRQEAVVTEPVLRVFGFWGATVVGLIVCAAALSTINATIFTGARSMFALGESFPPLRGLGGRSSRTGTPANAILTQLAITLGLIGFGATTRDGFTAMVEYTAPVFWAFLFLVGVSLFVFRLREPDRVIPFRVPLYPLTPLVFCATALYLLYSSVNYTGLGALIGIGIVALGIPVFLLGERQRRLAPAGPDEPVPAE